MLKVTLVKGTKERAITSDMALELMHRYSVAGSTYNTYGQVIYLYSRDMKRIHSIVIARA